MQFSSILAIAAVFGSGVIATPIAEPAEKSMMATAATQWTLKGFKRVCTADAKSCQYTYSIDTKSGAPTACSYKVTGNPASRQTYQNQKCGAFTIGSTWSGQFGANKGFQTLSVVRNRQIIYPAYTDAQLAGGKTVSPDQSYTPANLP